MLTQVQGKDALNLLNRTCSQLIKPETVQQGCISHLLNPKGKILCTFGMMQDKKGRVILEMHRQAYEIFKPAIEKFVIFEEFSLQEIASFSIVSTTTPPFNAVPSALFKNTSLHYVFEDGTQSLDEVQFTNLRVKNKIPIFPLDYTSDFFAVESDVICGIHFQKGCYPGQETVSKTVFRGATPYVLYWAKGDKGALQACAEKIKGTCISKYDIERETYAFVRLPRNADITALAHTHQIHIERHALSAPLPK